MAPSVNLRTANHTPVGDIVFEAPQIVDIRTIVSVGRRDGTFIEMPSSSYPILVEMYKECVAWHLQHRGDVVANEAGINWIRHRCIDWGRRLGFVIEVEFETDQGLLYLKEFKVT